MAKYVKTEDGYRHIEGLDNTKMDKNDPVGTGSFSMGRKDGSPVGYNSHAEGSNTTASGDSSHAEGSNTTASGDSSHAEGSNTTASGAYSHAEGSNTKASSYNSHAEGFSTTASGNDSHAEGYYTTASGSDSHAEGYYTTASGAYSHAEGSGTKASSYNSHAEGSNTTASGNNSHVEGLHTGSNNKSQHVQGEYNIVDKTGKNDTRGKYAHIVGNGTGINQRSNAHTIDWSGNAWYAGDVYVGSTSGTNKDEGSKKLATEEYVDNSIASIDIPTTLPNPQSLTFTGAVEGTYDGSSALTVEIPSAPDIPTALPNPKSLTFTGAVNASYDGSSEVSVEIPDALSDLSEDATHRVVTDVEKAKWNAKAEVLAIPTKVSQLTNDSDFATNSDVTTGISTHNSSTEAHNDIRLLVQELTNKLNTLADSDDTTLDQLSEIVAYIKNNKSLIDGITTSKVSVTDIIDNLTTSATNKPLSAKQGVALKALIDAIVVPTKLPNPNAITFTGAAEGTYDGSSALTVDIPSVPDIPTKLPNPSALEFTGAVTGTYDGSTSLSVNIPTVDDVLAALPAWEGGSY